MVLRSGPHRFHAIASRDMKAGAVIVQCLPTAYSITELNAEELIKDASLRKSFNRSSIPKRCTYCLFKEEGEFVKMRGRSGGICSKCSMVHYCSKSCQVCSICIKRQCCIFSLSILHVPLIFNSLLNVLQVQDWKEHHKLECQYYVERCKRSIGTPCVDNNELEFDARFIPLILRTFSKLKFLREESLRAKENPKEVGQEYLIYQGEPIISCSPRHFSAMPVFEVMFSVDPTYEAAFQSPAWTLAKELMGKFALTNQDYTKSGTDAALAIWSFGTSESDKANKRFCNTIDQAIQWTCNIMRKSRFSIKSALNNSSIGGAIYPCAALLNHSCIPNCILRYKLGEPRHNADHYHQPILQVIACRDISAGEELCHSYVNLTLCPKLRKEELFESWGFVCSCQRCVAGKRCVVKLPVDWQSNLAWPLQHGIALYGGHPDNGARSVKLMDVRLDDVLTWCQGLSEDEQSRVNHQSKILQQKAEKSSTEQKAMRLLKQAVALYHNKGEQRWSPFHSKVYEARNAYSLSIKMKRSGEDFIGIDHESGTPELLEQLMQNASFLAVAYTQVENHPEFGLHLYKTGDLNLRRSFQKVSNDMANANILMARALFLWAKKVLIITHGHDHHMVRNADIQIAFCNSLSRPVQN
jgi:hypothetical protein